MPAQTQNGQPANYNSTAPTLTNGDGSSLNVDSRGNLKITSVVIPDAADSTLIGRTSIVFASGDDLTTEKTATITLSADKIHSDGLFLLAVEKVAENTAGNMTVKVYNQIKINGTDTRDALLTTLTTESVTDTAVYRCYLLQGLFVGELSIKIGASFVTDSGAITPYFALYSL